ncbi:hypothetical protein NUM3379_42540 [Kineococcus sp. NUM-3379]
MTSTARHPAAPRSAVRERRAVLLAVVLPPLLLAVVGLFHPHHLDAGTASWWTLMHVLLLPVFPLLGVAHWVLLRGEPGVLAWLSRTAAFLYVTLYGALDALAGIGTGTLLLRSGAADQDDLPEVGWLFGAGNQVGGAGAWCLLAACVLTSVVLWRRSGVRVLPGALLLLAATWVFNGEHIYFPTGVLSVLGIAAGSALLVLLPPQASR